MISATPISKFFTKPHEREEQLRLYAVLDKQLLGVALFLLFLGLIMVGSASTSIAEKMVDDPFHFFWRQFAYMTVGLLIAATVLRVPLEIWEKSGLTLILLSILLLMLVFVPGLGREVNGSQRWIMLGPLSLQVSELVKLFSVVYLAGYLVRHHGEVRSRVMGFMRPLVLLTLLGLLLLLEPDYGAVVVLFLTAFGMMWLGGVRLSQFILLLMSLAGALALLALTSPYRLQRLTTFLNPWADPYDSGFQLTQALIAFGRGEWLGVGLGSSIQKLFYLPEAHTDFLFAVMAEELGLFMVALVVLAYLFLVFKALNIGRRAEKREQPFSGYVAYGIGIWVGLQAFINIGVNMGVLPTKGLTLPLMSYGGSSLVVMCVAVALLLRIDYETRKYDRRNTSPKGRRA
ncbi:MAG: putative lipid II flippase FtsW [Thiohalophilus sp.]|uniref:putative lipid II flippase FtsW n=1 Tax=Thiohalophilus sp. TaxID=3028392 RepID=UPI00287048B0|nr:putative lipid II flippase FtsW [Thiohalophilus sp.]MDR9435726.1 putative lipid II flippase FtsW [Thiohalophilus sp.]